MLNADAVLFDVGANVSDYTNELLKYFTKRQIHCFEPSKSTYNILCSNIKNLLVTINNLGLSNSIGKQMLYFDHEGSGLASLYDRQLDYLGKQFGSSEEIELMTFDQYCVDRSIDHIDFLKMDVEGNELNVLKGAKRMLDENRITAIQLEFGGVNVDSRSFFWGLLESSS